MYLEHASERLSERLSEHPERIAASTHMVRADHATRLNALRMISMVLSKALSPLRSRKGAPIPGRYTRIRVHPFSGGQP